MHTFYIIYSVLRAKTGSFLAACLDGISPPIKVNITLKTTKIIAAPTGNIAVILVFTLWIIAFVGISRSSVVRIPNIPENNPTINVSALNIEEIFFFEAPIALSIPISLVLSRTDMYVIIPIIMEDTINDILTNAINT